MRHDSPSMRFEDVRDTLAKMQAGDVCVLPESQGEQWTQPLLWAAPPDTQVLSSAIASGAEVEVGGGDHTVILDALNRAGWDVGCLEITMPAQGSFRLGGLTVKGIGDISWNGMLRLHAQNQEWRADHIHPIGGTIGFSVFGVAGGVIDSSLIEIGSQLRFYGYGENGDQAWAEPTGLGSKNFVFVEDCVLYGDGGAPMDAYRGAKYAFRHNRFINGGVQTHPTGGSHRARGVRAMIVEDNIFDADRMGMFNLIWLSSGTGVICRNRIAPGAYNNFITAHAMRRDNKTYQQTPTPNGWGYAGTSFTGIGSNFDGNEDPVTGWPNLDMVGRGMGDLLEGYFPTVRNAATGCDSARPCLWPRQAFEPYHVWDNDFSGGNEIFIYEPDTIQVGRDIVFAPMEGYESFAYPHYLRGNVVPSPEPPEPPKKKPHPEHPHGGPPGKPGKPGKPHKR